MVQLPTELGHSPGLTTVSQIVAALQQIGFSVSGTMGATPSSTHAGTTNLLAFLPLTRMRLKAQMRRWPTATSTPAPPVILLLPHPCSRWRVPPWPLQLRL
ncbi:hypothetical protein C0992_009822 [Termitomyces sp. T32_za158]|nr:hypothetical protein C0992_009822 [Termitomyces sp. T32_za158]